eukprot:1824959-Rhodomonas_salina.1
MEQAEWDYVFDRAEHHDDVEVTLEDCMAAIETLCRQLASNEAPAPTDIFSTFHMPGSKRPGAWKDAL